MSGTIEFSESFENGTTGAALTTSTTAFTFLNGAGTGTFDDTYAADGVLSAKLVSDGTAGKFYAMQHNFSVNQNLVFARVAVYFTALPAAPLYVAFAGVVSGTSPQVRVNANGTISLRNNSAVVATSTSTITTGNWTLIEWSINATASTQSARFYNGLSGTPAETITGTYNQGIMKYLQYGITATLAATLWFDAIADAFDDWVGPLGTSVSPTGVYQMQAGKLVVVQDYQMSGNVLS